MPTIRTAALRFVIFAVGLLGAGLAQAQVVKLRSGLLAQPAAATLYVMNPAGGIDAINSADGSLRWHSDSAQRPLALQQDRLLAQGNATDTSNELALVLLDAGSGVAVASGFAELPPAVTVSIDDSLGHQFSL